MIVKFCKHPFWYLYIPENRKQVDFNEIKQPLKKFWNIFLKKKVTCVFLLKFFYYFLIFFTFHSRDNKMIWHFNNLRCKFIHFINAWPLGPLFGRTASSFGNMALRIGRTVAPCPCVFSSESEKGRENLSSACDFTIPEATILFSHSWMYLNGDSKKNMSSQNIDRIHLLLHFD